jgi:hypothetical protein
VASAEHDLFKEPLGTEMSEQIIRLFDIKLHRMYMLPCIVMIANYRKLK